VVFSFLKNYKISWGSIVFAFVIFILATRLGFFYHPHFISWTTESPFSQSSMPQFQSITGWGDDGFIFWKRQNHEVLRLR
jgi:hypothetical protein